MKKCLALLLLMIAVLFLYACTPQTSTTAASTTQTPGTAAPTTGPTVAPTTQTTVPPTTQSPVTTPPTAHTHEFGPWIVIQRQTCQKPEISTHICACNATEQIVTKEPGEHSYGEDGQCATCQRRISLGLSYQLSEDGQSYILISSHECTDEAIVIPETYLGLPVSGIGYAAFALSEITRVELPGTVQFIDDNAFQDCYRLTDISLPDSLVSIGDWAFSGTGLKNVHLPEKLQSIGREAFQNCDSLLAFTVAEENKHFTALDGVLFSKNADILLVYPATKKDASYTVPDTVAAIGPYAFLGCRYLKQLQLPEGLLRIEEAAFAGSGLTSITLPASVSTIGDGAFGNDRETGLPGDGDCKDLAEILVQEGNASFCSIDGVLFTQDGTTLLVYPAGKTGDSYTTPAGTTHIGVYAFVGCTQLKEITLCEGVTHIGKNAFSAGFYDVSALERIYLPSTLQQIDEFVLAYCYNLTDIYFAADSWQWLMVIRSHDWDAQTGPYTMHYTREELI